MLEWKSGEEQDAYEHLWEAFSRFGIGFLGTLTQEQHRFVLDVRGVLNGSRYREADCPERVAMRTIIETNPARLQEMVNRQFFPVHFLEAELGLRIEQGWMETHRLLLEDWQSWYFLCEGACAQAVPLIREFLERRSSYLKERRKRHLSEEKIQEYYVRASALLSEIDRLETVESL